MTEVERLLQQTLHSLEKEMNSRVNLLVQEVGQQQRQLAAQEDLLRRLQTQVKQLENGQEQSAQSLLRLSAVHNNLEPLLAKLNSLLSGR